MEPSRRNKRQRLMVLSSYVSPRRRPDVPATFESLNDDTLTTTLEFVGNKSYRSIGSVNKHCREIYLKTKGMEKETFVFGYASLAVIIDRVNVIIERASEEEREEDNNLLRPVGQGVVVYNRRDVMDWALHQDRNEYVLRGICVVAAGEGRIDLLNEVFNNIEVKKFIFLGVSSFAALRGKLDVLKWLDVKELYINKECCASMAAHRGQLHILKWLKEEKDLELKKYLYNDALGRGGHLHVMKWLREQKVDWEEYVFRRAAYKGNLVFLQWLHDEGCPWPDIDDGYRLEEGDLKPGVIDWLRANGYIDRIVLELNI